MKDRKDGIFLLETMCLSWQHPSCSRHNISRNYKHVESDMISIHFYFFRFWYMLMYGCVVSSQHVGTQDFTVSIPWAWKAAVSVTWACVANDVYRSVVRAGVLVSSKCFPGWCPVVVPCVMRQKWGLGLYIMTPIQSYVSEHVSLSWNNTNGFHILLTWPWEYFRRFAQKTCFSWLDFDHV